MASPPPNNNFRKLAMKVPRSTQARKSDEKVEKKQKPKELIQKKGRIRELLGLHWSPRIYQTRNFVQASKILLCKAYSSNF